MAELPVPLATILQGHSDGVLHRVELGIASSSERFLAWCLPLQCLHDFGNIGICGTAQIQDALQLAGHLVLTNIHSLLLAWAARHCPNVQKQHSTKQNAHLLEQKCLCGTKKFNNNK